MGSGMPKQIEEGQIYFIRERDFESSTLTPLVKIGLVKNAKKRDSYERLGDHQTGNPRKLEVVNTVDTIYVDDVESSLHNRFADRRRSGEWFDLESEDTLREFISKARELASDMEKIQQVFEKVERLADTPDNGDTISATDNATDHAIKLSLAYKQRGEANKIIKEINSRWKKALVEGEDLKGVASLTESKRYDPDYERLRREKPDLYVKFLTLTSGSFNYTKFRNSVKIEDAVDFESFKIALDKIKADMTVVTEQRDAYLLDPIRKEAQMLKAFYKWEVEKYEALLRIDCGENQSIDQVCSWDRKINDKFDLPRFKKEHPAIAQEYRVERGVSALVVNRGKG